MVLSVPAFPWCCNLAGKGGPRILAEHGDKDWGKKILQ